MRILIAYGTTEGHTRKICEHLADKLKDAGKEIELFDTSRSDLPEDLHGYDACFLAGSLHLGRYQASLTHFARQRHEALNALPSAFISVSLSAAGLDPHDWEGLTDCLVRFEAETLWRPRAVHHAAGAIRYSQYDYFKRLALRYIAERHGLETSTVSDYDLTDYPAIVAFATAFLNGSAT